MIHPRFFTHRLYFIYAMAILGLLSACQQTESPSDTTQYQVIFRESAAGEYTKMRTAPNEYKYYFTYTDRGRGPEYQETISLGEEGFIQAQSIQGVNYLKDSINEQFSLSGETARIDNPLGEKTSDFLGQQLYFRFDGSPATYEVLANLLEGPYGKKIALYPEGEAELIQSLPMMIAGTDARLLMIKGLDTKPVYIWMKNQEMIARLEGNQHVVRDDLLDARREMKAIQDSLENEYLFEQANELTRDYSQALIKNVSVFTAKGKVLPRRDVLVNGATIESIVPTGGKTPNAETLVLDGSGKFLMPGMFDMHTHNNKFRGAMYIAGGLTSVRDLANNKQLIDLQTQFDKNEIIGPRIVYMCGIIDGSGPYANKRNVVDNLEEGLREVQVYKDLGYQQIKLYSSIRPEWVKPLADKSHELGMKVSGHIPAFMTAAQAIEQGYDEIQHINMLFLSFMSDTIDTRTPLRFTMVAQHGGDLDLQSKEYLDFVNTLQSRNIIVDPTVAIFENMFLAKKGEPSPTYKMIMDRFPSIAQRDFLSGGLPRSEQETPTYRAAFDKMLEVIHDLYQKEVPLVPGTDGLPGFLYHRELELYQQAGIPPTELLKMATIHSAKIAGVEDSLGSIEVGKRADLILVNGNPLEEISDLRKVEWTMKDGHLFYAKELYASMGIRY